MKGKMFSNISVEKPLYRKIISIKNLLVDYVSQLHIQHVNNTTSIEQIGEEVQNESDSKVGLGKPQLFENNISDSLNWNYNGKAATGIVKSSEVKSNSEAEEMQNF